MGLLDTEVAKWKRAFGLLGGIPKTFKNNPRNAETMDAVFGFGGIIPGIGDAVSAAEAKYRYDQGDMLGAGLAGVGALPMVPSLAGMFIGKGAKTWDVVKAAKADDMEKAGVDRATIWKETGTWKGPDNQWRQEIPDDAAKHSKEWMWDYETKPVSNAIKHDDLFRAYPSLSDTKIRLSPSNQQGASFNPDTDLIEFYSGNKSDAAASMNLHELQHAIQKRESFARGGSPEAMRSFLAPDPSLQSAYSQAELYDAYHRLAGEAEARLTQARMPMTMDERLTTPPWTMFDVPESQQIVRFGDGSAMSTGRPRNHLGQEIPPTPYELAHAEAQRVAALPVEQGGLGLPPDNTYIDRAKAMGYVTDVMHGAKDGNQPSLVASRGGELGPGSYVTRDGNLASEFAHDAYGAPFPEGSGVYPLTTKSLLEIPRKEWVNKRAGKFDDLQRENSGEWSSEFYDQGHARLMQDAERAGFSGYYTPGLGGENQGVVFNPKNIRSRFAAFNPAKRDSADLLAGIAPWAMPIGATLLGGSFLLPPEEY